ncbi:MAG TPA: GNAT family N-acetyltransferase [Candidatus Tumulicola sp.]|nr:GNAT family N-acetyltransferase [Candidatus Tumulicola sp.]
MSGRPIVETERLIVRAWEDGDEEALIAIFADPGTVRYLGKGYQHGLRADQTRAMVERMRERFARTGLGVWPVVLKETGAVIGECGLAPVADSDDVEIAYVLSPAARGKGYASEAAAAVLAYAFQTLKLARVVAFVHRGNAASIAVINRLGMRYDRVVRAFRADVMRYVALA